ncbi:MAG: ABC transporter ATP-binding protein [Pseudomonadota bacterium]
MSKSVLSIEDVDIFYGGFQALETISLEIASGDTFGLIGLNGAGKTTLIKAILSLRDNNAGSIKVRGEPSFKASVKKHIAYLPERFNPPTFLRGMEFLHFSLSLYNKKMSDQEFCEAAENLALNTDVLTKSVNTYSKGMRQKLGLLGTLLTGCDLMILDEPMSGLDPRARAYVKDMLRQAKSDGRSIFLSSHILADMAEICDHIAILHDKQIQYDGTPKDLMTKTGKSDLEHAFLDIIEKEHPKAA